MFNNRPNSNAAKMQLISKLQEEVAEVNAQLEQAMLQAAEAEDMPELECDMDVLCDELRRLQCAAKDAKGVYDQSTGWDTPARFKNKCRYSLFCKLKEIQEISLQCSNANVTAVHLQMFQCMLDGAEERRSLLVDEVIAEMEENPVDDWFCEKFAASVLAVN